MKLENEKLRISRIIFFLLVVMIAVAEFISCTTGDNEKSSETVTRYGYKLNYNDSYHRVVKYTAINDGDDTFEVKECSIHFFSKSNENYQKRTGAELCDIVATNAVPPSSSKTLTAEKESFQTLRSSMSDIVQTFHINKGLKYTIYYYF